MPTRRYNTNTYISIVSPLECNEKSNSRRAERVNSLGKVERRALLSGVGTALERSRRCAERESSSSSESKDSLHLDRICVSLKESRIEECVMQMSKGSSNLCRRGEVKRER
jgi:hypothetical protein